MGVAWYRLRATWRRQLGGLVAIVVLVGIAGGIALAAIAGARRTQSSYPRFLASTRPSDLTVSSFTNAGEAGVSVKTRIEHLAGVVHTTTVYTPPVRLVDAKGSPVENEPPNVFPIASGDGELWHQDRLAVLHGRLPDLRRTDEVVVTASAARQLHAHVGSALRLGLFADSSQTRAARVSSVRVVGVVAVNNQIVQDDVDSAFGFLVLTPAFLHEALAVAGDAAPTLYGLELARHAASVTATERLLVPILPPGQQYEFHALGPVVSAVEDSVRPESIALGAFGVIAGLVALVVTAQAISRQLSAGDGDRQILRALGAGTVATSADGLIGVLLAVVCGSLLAVIIGLALSPLSPLGPVRPVDPSRGLTVDATVLAAGFAGLVLALSTVAFVVARRRAPQRLVRRRALGHRTAPASLTARFRARLPAAAGTGVGFAFGNRDDPSAVPMRSSLVGAAVAVALVVGTLTFANGLDTLVSHPALYGWNWSYQIVPTAEIPPVTRGLLAHDHDVAHWTSIRYAVSDIDGQNVPILLGTAKAAVAPPLISGHGLDAANQIVLGASTLARLHKHVGDTVVLTYGARDQAPAYIPPVRLRVVGTAAFPAVGFSSFVADHTSMGTGALVAYAVEPRAFRAAQLQSDSNLNGPDLVFVRMRPGVSTAVGLADMRRVTTATNRVLDADPVAQGNSVYVQGAQRPAQIVNYRTVGAAPVLLAIGLALGAIVALGLTLVASVRRHRRDLALLKTIGFTRRQLSATVAWQASAAAGVGVLFGVPLGILLGRWLWSAFARRIDAIPRPTVPGLLVVAVALGTVVLANLVAAIPGRIAARTRAAPALQAD